MTTTVERSLSPRDHAQKPRASDSKRRADELRSSCTAAVERRAEQARRDATASAAADIELADKRVREAHAENDE